jgi:23S rRNA (uracil1939-C5)-methyltransferase
MNDFPYTISNLKIEKCVHQGYGLAHHEGSAVFIENALPGDVIHAEILYKKKTNLFGKTQSIIQPSPLRKQERCELAARCGGCDWVNINYSDQLQLKNEILKDIYRPLQEQVLIKSITASDQTDYYRNKSFMPLSLNEEIPVYGMYARSSHEVVSQKHCYIHPPVFNQIADEIIDYIQKSHAQIYNEKSFSGNLRHIGVRSNHDHTEILLILVTKNRKLPFTNLLLRQIQEKFPQVCGVIQNIQPHNSNVILGQEDKLLFGRYYLNEKLNHLSFKIHYKAFFQVNLPQANAMYQLIRSLSGTDKVVLDAYSGTGTIGISLADIHQEIICVESNPEASENARENANINSIINISFIQGEVERVLPDLMRDKQIDLIVFDPPRKGLDDQIIDLIASLNIPEVIYMSCNPSTQCRDLIRFLKQGYQTSQIIPFDMFPHTWHIESLCLLKRQ